MASRLQNLFSGFTDSFRFSNRFGLIAQRLFQRSAPIVHYVWQGRWHLYCNPKFGDHGSIKEVLAQDAYGPCLNKICRARSFTYVNVGANVGAFDIAVASRGVEIPYACSVELNPWTYSRLAFNMSANELYSVRVVNVGIAGEPGVIPFSPRESSVTDCIFNQATAAGGVVQNVELDTLESVLSRLSMTDKTFDLLKLDAEGAEYGIVETMPLATLQRFGHIVMEFHQPPDGASPQAIYEKFTAAGFVSDQPHWAAGSPHELRMWRRA